MIMLTQKQRFNYIPYTPFNKEEKNVIRFRKNNDGF